MKERALASQTVARARLFTCATLTGHSIRAYGRYGIAMDNGPARKAQIGPKIQSSGHLLGDPFELSTLRRDDFDFVAASGPREDIVQANALPSTLTARGHQYPMAFMIRASGLDRHGLSDATPISYTHLDIAGSAEESGVGGCAPLGRVTGSPVVALAATFLTRFVR